MRRDGSVSCELLWLPQMSGVVALRGFRVALHVFNPFLETGSSSCPGTLHPPWCLQSAHFLTVTLESWDEDDA